MDGIFLQAEQRRTQALEMLGGLGLMERWSLYGSPVIVGALRHGLMVAPDIDLEIYCDRPQIAHGFNVMSDVAHLPGIWKVRFSNELDAPDQGLYWGIHCRQPEGEVWKVDNWLLSHDHPHAHWAEGFADALERALTDESRRVILEIKADARGDKGVRGIDVYRAVLEGGVRSPSEFRCWIEAHTQPGMVLWMP